MPNPSSSPLLARARFFTCTLVTLTVACGAEPTAPQSLSVQQASVETGRPYYLYEGRPVYLEVDPTRLTVSEPKEGAEAALAASLAGAGLAGAWLERLPLEPQAFTVHLAKGTSAQEAQRAAEVLRREGRHGFVANVYQSSEGAGEVVLHNRLVVHLKKGFGDAMNRGDRCGRNRRKLGRDAFVRVDTRAERRQCGLEHVRAELRGLDRFELCIQSIAD